MAEEKLVLKSPVITITPSNEQDLWNADWNITLTKEDKKIGTASFHGEKEMGTVPLSVNVDGEYADQDYEKEALAMMVDWAFHFRNIYEVKSETDREDDFRVRALKKTGFVYRSSEGRQESYSIIKPKTAWTGAYLFIGIFLGLIFGLVFSHLLVGMIVGVAIGVAIGLSMDVAANKEREKVTGKSLTR